MNILFTLALASITFSRTWVYSSLTCQQSDLTNHIMIAEYGIMDERHQNKVYRLPRLPPLPPRPRLTSSLPSPLFFASLPLEACLQASVRFFFFAFKRTLALYNRSHGHLREVVCSKFLFNYMALSAIRTQNQNFTLLLYTTSK